MKGILCKLPTISTRFLFKSLYIINSFMMIISILMVVLGSVALGIACTAKPTYKSSTSTILIVVGVILAIICMIAVHGISKGSRYSLQIVAVAASIFTIIVGLTTLFAFIFREQAFYGLRDEMYRMLKDYDTNKHDKKCWDSLQPRNKCCGVEGYQDWIENRGLIPLSCCPIMTKNYPNTTVLCSGASNSTGIILPLTGDGCYQIFEDGIQLKVTVLMSSGLVLCCFSTMGTITTFILVKRLKQGEDRKQDV